MTNKAKIRTLRPIRPIRPIGPIRRITLALVVTSFLIAAPVHAQTGTSQSFGFLNYLTGKTSQILTLNNPVELVNPLDGFEAGDKPSFVLEIPQKNQDAIGEIKEESWQVKDEKITASFTHQGSTETIPATIQKESEGQFSVSLPINNPDLELQRGNYTLEVTARESFIYERNLTQDFSWGVLAINTNKSIYIVGETANLAIGVLSETGSTVCDAKLELVIADPNKNESKLSTENNSITKNPDCGNSYTPEPDYATSYQTNKAGRYYMHITAQTKNGTYSITDYFEVKDTVPFDIERVNFPTRIYPAAAYDVQLKIKANRDYKGEVTDTVLKSFKVTNISNGGTIASQANFEIIKPALEVIQNDNKVWEKIPEKSELAYANTGNLDKSPTTINWNVDWKQGETYTLSYTLNFPPISPEYYLIGPFKVGPSPVIASDPSVIASEAKQSQEIATSSQDSTRNDNVVFSEIRQWQIASDATVCWAGTVDANWSTANNWVTTLGAAATIASTDVAVFDSSATTCSSGGTNNNSTIDATFGGSIQAVSILTYTGTVTQSRSLTITTGGATVGFVQSAASSTYNQGANNITATTVATSDFDLSNGTFNGGSGNITITDEWSQSGGTFNDGTGTVTVRDNWTYTSGTFTANEGTFLFDANTDNTTTVTGSAAFNNLTFTSNEVDGAPDTFTIASGTTLTVSGTLTLDNSSNNASPSNFNGPGQISAQGAITTTVEGLQGNAIIAINGTGDQTFTGEADTNTLVPSININKPSGTLSFVNTVSASNDWTYSQGNLSMGTSTIILSAWTDQTPAITGPMTFNNLTFSSEEVDGGVDTFTIASGTTLTVSGTLTINNSSTNNTPSILNGPGQISAQGAITTTVEGLEGNAIIAINGTGNQTFTGEADTNTLVPSININKPSGTLSFVNTIAASNDWTYSQGTLSMGTSTISFNAFTDDTPAIAGSMTFNNLSFISDISDPFDGAPDTYTIASGTTLTVSGTLTISDISTNASPSNINGPGQISAQGAITTTTEGLQGSVAITLTGSASQTINSPSTLRFPTGTFTVNKSSGVATLAANFSVNATGQDLYIRSGTLSLASFNLTVNDVFNIEPSGTLRLRGAETVSTIDSNTGTLEFTGDGDGVADNPFSTITTYGTTMGNLTINSTDTGANRDVFVLGAALDVNGNVTITAGNLDVSATNFGLTTGGAFSNSDVFTQRSGTVTFDDRSQYATIAGTTTFFNLTDTTAGDSLRLTSGTTTTVSGTLTLTGSAGNLVGLVATTAASIATINVTGTASITFTAIKDITATTAFTAATSYNNGNNTNITFTDEAGAGTPLTRIKGGTTINGRTKICTTGATCPP